MCCNTCTSRRANMQHLCGESSWIVLCCRCFSKATALNILKLLAKSAKNYSNKSMWFWCKRSASRSPKQLQLLSDARDILEDMLSCASVPQVQPVEMLAVEVLLISKGSDLSYRTRGHDLRGLCLVQTVVSPTSRIGFSAEFQLRALEPKSYTRNTCPTIWEPRYSLIHVMPYHIICISSH